MASAPPSLNLGALLAADPELLGRFLNTIGDALFAVDAAHNIVFWNQRAEALTGFGADEVLGRHCLSGIRCEKCLYECRLFEQGTVDDARISLGTKDGRTLKVRKNAFVLRDRKGQVLGGIELLRDETELSERIASCRAQRLEIASRERLQAAVLGSIREGVLTIDPNFRITSFSRRAEQITGQRAEDVVGRHCHDVLSSRLCDEDCPAEHCLETGDPEADRVTELTSRVGAPLPIAETAIPLRDEHGKNLGTVLLIEDRSADADVLAEVEGGASYLGIIGRSAAMRRVFRTIAQVAPTDATVLLTGESGTGKELTARAVHLRSGRRGGPFQAINCAALPETLLESELFGHAKGAFTGADRTRPGRIEAAQGGSLFLDEIGEMSLGLQAKLLRFLQEREYERVGESRTRSADVRIIAATNRDLEADVASGRFREDLYYRVHVIPIWLPPLRERREDIPLLAARLLQDLAARRGRPELSLTPAALGRLVDHPWPGNVRELINALEYAVALAPGKRIRPADLPPALSGASGRYTAGETPPAEEAARIKRALETHRGNRSRTAHYLGMDRVTLYRKMKKFGIA